MVIDMAHYVFLNEYNVVTEVIVGKDETDTTHDWELYYGSQRGVACKRTSYNGNIRKNYAGIGYTYDSALDAFVPPKPYPSWLLDTNTCQWQSPIPYPTDGKMYTWDEETQSWVEVAVS